jgi:surfeit locus 1 family protein
MRSRTAGFAKTSILVASAIGLAVIFAALGHWQLRRADEQHALERQFASLTAAPPLETLPEPSSSGPIDDMRYRRVVLRGRYLPQIQVLLDNMTHAGAAGYHVLTPFVPSAGGRAVVVNRGFVAAPAYRSELPSIAVSAEERTLRGRIDVLPAPAIRLAEVGSDTNSAVHVMSFPESQDLERVLDLALVPYQILLDSAEADGYVRAWEPESLRAERNLAYAGQWFALCLATFVAGLGLLLRSRLRKSGAQ